MAVIGLFIPLRAWLSSERISLLLLAFFTFGHHLPGFLRAYGDRELFERYPARFLLAPPLIFGATLLFDTRGLHGLLFLVFAWDIWHVLMQHYGFMRIYDAKRGRTEPLGARLDWAVSLSWYVTFVVMSPHYRHDLLYRAYSTGVPSITGNLIDAAVTAMVLVSLAATLAFLGYHFAAWRRGTSINPQKLATLASFLFASWFLYVQVDDFVLGFAVWSAFHCIQYFGIVWVFSENRVRKTGGTGIALKGLFRPGPVYVLLYLALIFAYGALNLGPSVLDHPEARRLFMAFIITSGALHYYYDGFIWKVREPQTQRHLEIRTRQDQAVPPLKASITTRLASGWMHAAVGATLLIGAAALESARPPNNVVLRAALAEASPDNGAAQLNLADALRENGSLDQAIAAYFAAVERSPRNAQARLRLGLALAEIERLEEAVQQFDQAVVLDGGLTEAHYNAGVILARLGHADAAIMRFQDAFAEEQDGLLKRLTSRPGGADILNNLAMAALKSDNRSGAEQMWRSALEADPSHVDARLNLANLHLLEGRLPQARGIYQQILRDQPRHPVAHNNLGLTLLRLGLADEARPHLEFALQQGDTSVRGSARRALNSIGAR